MAATNVHRLSHAALVMGRDEVGAYAHEATSGSYFYLILPKVGHRCHVLNYDVIHLPSVVFDGGDACTTPKVIISR